MTSENTVPGSAAPETAAIASVLVIITNTAQFRLGEVRATPGAIAAIQKARFSPVALLNRHMHGDFGDCGEEDRETNAAAVKYGYRILSVYRLVDGAKLTATPASMRSELPTVWIITESDRSCTTFLLPEEY